MPTRNVVLTNHQTQFVEQLVTSGRYQNASEVLREGLRMVAQRTAEDESRLLALRGAVQTGIADMESGAYRHFASADELGTYLDALTNEAING